MSKCPNCFAIEIESHSLRTAYLCGSSDYDQREGTFIQSNKCKIDSAILEANAKTFQGLLKW